MKHMEEYRDGDLARDIAERIISISKKPARLMEICGTHTMAIFRHGIRTLIPDRIELVSGPGCPVCVTAMEEIDRSVKLSKIPDVIVTTFGDMIRVPGSSSSLQNEKGKGGDIRMVYSTFDALKIAEENPEKEVVFLGIGFETTAPTVAAAIKVAKEKNMKNFSVLSSHKLLPPAMNALISGGELNIDGFICPGHVTTIIGTAPYKKFINSYPIPCVVTGFEPVDILQGILMLALQIEKGEAKVEIQYERAVSEEGNIAAFKIMDEIFKPCDAKWRGLGPIPDSGLGIGKEYSEFDALKRFDLDVPDAEDPPGCKCAEVLRGSVLPPECGLFRKLCTPGSPVGACMVSSEGTCAAYYKYSD